MVTKTYLPVLENVKAGDFARIRGEKLPLVAGNNPDEDLACGKCKQVIARNISAAELADGKAAPDGKLILLCTCGANNLIQIGSSNSSG